MAERCFIIIPFNAHYESIFEDVLKPALSELGVEAFISKDIKGIEWPFKKIHDGIKNSRFCIADITEPNENVMYEIGYASALEKKTILIWDKSKRPKDPSFDMNYFHGEPYNIEQEKTWSSKLARTIKEHFRAELAKATAVGSFAAKTEDEFQLDELCFKILSLLTLASAKRQEIGVEGMQRLLADLGEDAVESNLTLNKLLKEKYILRTLNMNGDAVCHYYNGEKADEYLRAHKDRLALIRTTLPSSFNGYGPGRHSWY